MRTRFILRMLIAGALAVIAYAAFQTMYGMWLTVRWEARLEEAYLQHADKNVSFVIFGSRDNPFLEGIKYAAAAAAGMLIYAGSSALLARRRRRDNLKRPQS